MARVLTGSRGTFKDVLIDFALLLASAGLFGLSFPSGVSKWGLFPLGFFAFFPVFIIIHRSGWVRTLIFGLIYGFVSYAFFNFWLLKFHPLAIFIVPVIYAVYFLILFPLLKLADTLFPDYGYLLQAVIWVAYEFLKTRGFLGYSYGVIGYSQYLFLPLARISAVFGVWGVSLLTVFPSCFLGNALKKGFGRFRAFFPKHRIEAYVFAGLFAAAVIFGIVTKSDISDAKQWRTALIQHNVDPWKHDYGDALDILISLSKQAMEKDPEIVVWSETAFVPAIEFHSKYRQNRETFQLVERLLNFLKRQDVPYVLGNDDGQLERIGAKGRIDYNAALLFEEGELKERYWKTHLVPFTEYFPFERTFPGIYEWLRNADTHFWEKGTDYTVFEADGVSFSTPICFEDTFGYISREFVKNGAEVIVNLTNDSWSFSVPAMMQHMAMSVFRSLETKRTMVRSTNGGITCIIGPNGRIIALFDPFVEGFLVAEAPVYAAETTIYTRLGDWFGFVLLFLGGLGLVGGIVLRIARRRRKAD